MSDIYQLLKISGEQLRDFQLLARRVDDSQTERTLKKNLSQLRLIEERMLVDKGLEVTPQSVEEVVGKVVRMAPSGDTSGENWTVRELRIVSYYLMKLRDDSRHYRYALELLNNNWKNLFLNGLVFYLLHSWHSIEPDYRTLTSQLIMRKLTEYDDSNRRYKLWKNRLNLFDDNGPARMAALLSAKGMSLQEAPTLLGFKKSSIKQPYYSDVIIKYVANNGITDFDSIKDILELNSLDRTKKLLFAYLVEKEDQRGDALRRAQLCRFANIQLGDVTLAASWAPFAGATEAEAQRLKEAMQLVNKWFARQIIEVFFEICVPDTERKAFWLEYIEQGTIDAFKIVGSTATKRLLQSNSKIGSMIFRLYTETRSTVSQTSALVMFIRNKMFVEFSDTGALYVYNQTHPMVRTVKRASTGIASTNDLKKTSMGSLVEKDPWGDYSIYHEEGKLHHRGNWQSRLNAWMCHFMLSPRDTAFHFMDKQQDDLFCARPLPQANLKPQAAASSITGNASRTQPASMTQPNDRPAAIHNERFSYKMASKPMEHNVRVVANIKGFYLALGQNRYELIKPFKPGEFPLGSLWIKQASMAGWLQIIHVRRQPDTHTVGFLKFTAEEVIFKESFSVAGKKIFKLY